MTTLTPTTAAKLAALSGLIPEAVGLALADLASAVPADQAIVELGSFRGKSTAYLAAGSKAGAGAPVHAVDPWDLPGNPFGKHGYSDPSVREAFDAQLRSVRLRARVEAHQAFSTDAARTWSGPLVGLLYIDGDHSEHAIRADLAAWEQHLAPGAVVAFDDLDTPRNPGVRIVVDDLVAGGWTVQVLADRLAVGRPPVALPLP